MPKKSKSREPIDRAAEYIDSPLMTQRLRFGKQLSARIAGNYGTYRTRLKLDARNGAECTCPSEIRPCKHVRALEATWDCHPASFVDLQDVLDGLANHSPANLLKLIAEMILAAPESLSALGYEAFGPEEQDNEYD